MSIKVKFFASMRDLVADDQEISAQNIQSLGIKTVADVWNFCAGDKPRPANVLIAVNMDYVDVHAEIKDGDEVAFFPPVTGG